jgi:ribosome-associated heat shock protein Hsp15
MDRVRIDKWLWAARFFKTRTLASEAVQAGRVEINGAKAKPSKDVTIGDTLDLRIGDMPWTVEVRGLADKRGSAAVAATLYVETPASIELRKQRTLERRLSSPLGADLGARPTKRDRRLIEDLRRRGGLSRRAAATSVLAGGERRRALADHEARHVQVVGDVLREDARVGDHQPFHPENA